jgi:hypothetical protein
VPRLLWELRDRRPFLTTLLLKTLLSAACFAAPGSPMAATLVALETELAPFFYLPAAALAALAAPVTAAAAPSTKVLPSPKPSDVNSAPREKEPAHITNSSSLQLSCEATALFLSFSSRFRSNPTQVSPFLSLPPPLQTTALHVVSHLPRLSPPTLRALAACALSPAAHPAVALTLVDMLRCRADNSSCEQDPPAYLAFLRTILMGHSPPRDAPSAEKNLDSQHSAAPPDAAVRALVEAAASALTALRGPGPLDGFLLLHLVWPEPSPEQQQQPPRATSVRAALGVLTAAAALLGGGRGGGGAAAESENEQCESGAGGLPTGAHPRQMDARLAALAAEYAVAATTTVEVDDARGGTTVGMMLGSVGGEAAAAAAARATRLEPVMTLLHVRGSLVPPTLNALAALAATTGGPRAAVVAADVVRTQAFALRLLRERAAVDAVVEAAAVAATAAAGDGATVRAADELRSCRDHLFGVMQGA